MINNLNPRWKNSQKYNRYRFTKNVNSTKSINRTKNQRGGIKL